MISSIMRMLEFFDISDNCRKSDLEAPMMGGIGERNRWRAREKESEREREREEMMGGLIERRRRWRISISIFQRYPHQLGSQQ